VHKVVLDTKVLVAGLRSRRGASFELLSRIGASEDFEINLSVPLVREYEDVLKRNAQLGHLHAADVDDVLDFLCAVGNSQEIFLLWRPVLRDPDDDMILELAVQAGCSYIVTHNVSDFHGCERFGIQAVTPRDFLEVLR
jgi:putative PIN family toxin of toxin-antitoxin system